MLARQKSFSIVVGLATVMLGAGGWLLISQQANAATVPQSTTNCDATKVEGFVRAMGSSVLFSAKHSLQLTLTQLSSECLLDIKLVGLNPNGSTNVLATNIQLQHQKRLEASDLNFARVDLDEPLVVLDGHGERVGRGCPASKYTSVFLQVEYSGSTKEFATGLGPLEVCDDGIETNGLDALDVGL